MPDYAITTTVPDGSPETRFVSISGAITIPNIGNIANEIPTALSGSSAVHLQLDNVTEIDATGLQLLCAIHRQLASTNDSCILSCTLSDAVYKAASEAGFLRHAGCIINEKCPCIWAGGDEP